MRIRNLSFVGTLYLIILFVLFTFIATGFSIYMSDAIGLKLYSQFAQIVIIIMLIANPLIPLGLAIYLIRDLIKFYSSPVKKIDVVIDNVVFSPVNLIGNLIYPWRYKVFTNKEDFNSFKIDTYFLSRKLKKGDKVRVYYKDNPLIVKHIEILK